MIERESVRVNNKLRDIIDSAATKRMYYLADMMDEWVYEDQIIIYINEK